MTDRYESYTQAERTADLREDHNTLEKWTVFLFFLILVHIVVDLMT